MWLTIVVGLQVFVAPILAFTATYILDVDWDTYTFSLQINLLPWIISAAMMYGVISLILGLAVGGYMPTRVADAGGWRPVLGLTRRLRDAGTRSVRASVCPSAGLPPALRQARRHARHRPRLGGYPASSGRRLQR